MIYTCALREDFLFLSGEGHKARRLLDIWVHVLHKQGVAYWEHSVHSCTNEVHGFTDTIDCSIDVVEAVTQPHSGLCTLSCILNGNNCYNPSDHVVRCMLMLLVLLFLM